MHTPDPFQFSVQILGHFPKSRKIHFHFKILKGRFFIVIFCVVSGCSALVFSLIYPLRMVQKLELLKRGSLLRITTYGNLTKSKQHSVSMDKISCAVNRQKANPYVKISASDYRLFFVLDNKVGTFHEPELFDRIIGSIKSRSDIG